jgi:putative transposase
MGSTRPQRKNIRLPGYDYSLPGAYFVTICTKGRIKLFGEIAEKKMIRNNYGDIVQSCWDDIPCHYPHVKLDEFVIMPDHIHGIIVINDNPVGSRHASTLLRGRSNVLGDIIGSFKSAATKRVNEIRHTSGSSVWQRGYYEHIIRDANSLNRIRKYIKYNPFEWPKSRTVRSFSPRC